MTTRSVRQAAQRTQRPRADRGEAAAVETGDAGSQHQVDAWSEVVRLAQQACARCEEAARSLVERENRSGQ